MLLTSKAIRLLDLSKAELKILKALDTRALNVSEISRECKLPRTSLLYILKKLERRTLIAAEHRNNKRIWKAAVKKALAELQTDSENNPPAIIIYRGVQAIFEIFDSWSSLLKNSRIAGLQPDRSIRQSLKKNSVDEWLRVNESIKRNGTIVEGIVHEKSIQTIVDEWFFD